MPWTVAQASLSLSRRSPGWRSAWWTKGRLKLPSAWYKKALQLPGLDDGSRCAIYYDLGMAFEAFGDKKSALANFMEV